MPTAQSPVSLATPLARPIYRHSVLPGGVGSAEELRQRLTTDAEAASHYRGIDIAKLRTARLAKERRAYVSYRTRKGIFWTRAKVPLRAGELVLTDGQREVRGRCGNRISDDPQQPVAELEPAVEAFEQTKVSEGGSQVPTWSSIPTEASERANRFLSAQSDAAPNSLSGLPATQLPDAGAPEPFLSLGGGGGGFRPPNGGGSGGSTPPEAVTEPGPDSPTTPTEPVTEPGTDPESPGGGTEPPVPPKPVDPEKPVPPVTPPVTPPVIPPVGPPIEPPFVVPPVNPPVGPPTEPPLTPPDNPDGPPGTLIPPTNPPLVTPEPEPRLVFLLLAAALGVAAVVRRNGRDR